ncbi:MAG: hypothetical protein FWF08_02660, partial [Oscillospiraceae bacterium]|nr:hypothetical protein [Oscillospiraceae bacterium]
MMRKILALSAVLLMLSAAFGCAKEGVEANTSENAETTAADNSKTADFLFTEENLPRLDGSTANIPMAVLMARRLLGVSEEEADRLVSFSTTPNAYINLIENRADLLLVYEA